MPDRLDPPLHRGAELSCRRNGGHLAAFASAAEQADVENAFIANGWLLPAFQKGYWIGLQAKTVGQWAWLDK
jgi:hypothetical protein